MVNDYVEVRDGRIFNLAFDFDLYIDETNQNNIANAVINTVAKYFDVKEHTMNEDIFLGPLIEQVNNVEGVINILEIIVYNKVGGQYSINQVSQEIVDEVTGEIRLTNNTVYSTEDGMF